MGGFQKITIVVPASDADWLLEESPVNRLEGLVRGSDQPLSMIYCHHFLGQGSGADCAASQTIPWSKANWLQHAGQMLQ